MLSERVTAGYLIQQKITNTADKIKEGYNRATDTTEWAKDITAEWLII